MQFSKFNWRRPRILAALVAAVLAVYILYPTKPRTAYLLAPVSRGDLSVFITATGTVEPEEVIDVGAQVVGRISGFGLDKQGKTVDYRSEVEQGMMLAKIDDVLYAADLAQAQAQAAHAAADVLQMQAKLKQAEKDWQRAQKLRSSGSLAEAAYDGYQAAFETAKANVTVAEAEVTQAQATVARAQQNLSYCTITSPVDGIVIDRRVNIGQTVVSSLNAPSLFLIAKDLKRMQVWVSVNEADVGKIFTGQKATFTVDAFPALEFHGEVRKVRLNASMTQNVVNYVVEVVTDNSDGKLLPYLTANVRFDVAHRENVLLVPTMALRWAPAEGKSQGAGKGAKAATDTRQVWVLHGNEPSPVQVKVGESDGLKTEIISDQISESDQVIVGVLDKAARQGSDAVNPFAPTMPRGARRS